MSKDFIQRQLEFKSYLRYIEKKKRKQKLLQNIILLLTILILLSIFNYSTVHVTLYSSETSTTEDTIVHFINKGNYIVLQTPKPLNLKLLTYYGVSKVKRIDSNIILFYPNWNSSKVLIKYNDKTYEVNKIRVRPIHYTIITNTPYLSLYDNFRKISFFITFDKPVYGDKQIELFGIKPVYQKVTMISDKTMRIDIIGLVYSEDIILKLFGSNIKQTTIKYTFKIMRPKLIVKSTEEVILNPKQLNYNLTLETLLFNTKKDTLSFKICDDLGLINESNKQIVSGDSKIIIPINSEKILPGQIIKDTIHFVNKVYNVREEKTIYFVREPMYLVSLSRINNTLRVITSTGSNVYTILSVSYENKTQLIQIRENYDKILLLNQSNYDEPVTVHLQVYYKGFLLSNKFIVLGSKDEYIEKNW